MKSKFFAPIIILALLLAASAFFVGPTQANPIIVVYNDVSPPDGANAPLINIYTPLNGSSYPKELALTFDVTFPPISGDGALDAITKIYYKGSWETKETTVAEGSHGSFSIDLSDVRGGNFSVTIFAVGEGLVDTGEDYREENGIVYSCHYFDRFEMTGSSTVTFIKDVVPLTITVLSPQNTTYTSSEVGLDYTVSEVASEFLYCLDGKENQTIAGSVFLTGLSEGMHNVTLYAADLAGNAAIPKTLFFSVDLPESWAIFLAIASVITVAVVGIGLLMYLKKRNRRRNP